MRTKTVAEEIELFQACVGKYYRICFSWYTNGKYNKTKGPTLYLMTKVEGIENPYKDYEVGSGSNVYIAICEFLYSLKDEEDKARLTRKNFKSFEHFQRMYEIVEN